MLVVEVEVVEGTMEEEEELGRREEVDLTESEERGVLLLGVSMGLETGGEEEGVGERV